MDSIENSYKGHWDINHDSLVNKNILPILREINDSIH